MQLDELINSDNIATLLDEDTLNAIAQTVLDGYSADETSRSGWINRYEKAIKLAAQVVEEKNYPWPKASNIKYPLMTLACLQFHARAYPSLVPSKQVVHVSTLGKDFMGIKARRSARVSAHMNYQVMVQMEDWDENMDRLLITIPITGTEFKKTYWDGGQGRNVSKHVFAKDLVINYWAKSLETAYRKTEIIELSHNELEERYRNGIYLSIEEAEPQPREDKVTQVADAVQGEKAPQLDASSPHTILECHTFYDMDEDGYAEPYIITIERDSRKVLRIVARFQKKNISKKNGQITKIVPDEYYTKYSFIPSPDGGFYDMGFGTLVGPINEAVNSIINMLVDAGTLSNLQSGFITKNFRAKGGSLQFQPGEWKTVNALGTDLKNGLFPLPIREPSGVLFNLLGLLIESGQRVASTTEMLVGENPGQNQKATTTQVVQENGLRVFTAIYKRLRRALGVEFKKLYNLNRQYLDTKEYYKIIDPNEQEQQEMSIYRKDYEDETLDIFPTADPNAVSQSTKQMQAQAILQVLPLGVPPRMALKRYFEALEIENYEELMPPEGAEQQPPPEIMLKMRDQQLKESVASHDAEIKDREQDRKEIETGIKERDLVTKAHLSEAGNRKDLVIAALGAEQKDMADRRKERTNERKASAGGME